MSMRGVTTGIAPEVRWKADCRAGAHEHSCTKDCHNQTCANSSDQHSNNPSLLGLHESHLTPGLRRMDATDAGFTGAKAVTVAPYRLQ